MSSLPKFTFCYNTYMDEEKKTSGFGLGLAIGAVAGALAGVFLAPKSGKQNRKDFAKRADELKEKFSEMEVDKKVQDIFGRVSEETRDFYLSATKELLERLSALKGKVEDIDTKKYRKQVEEVLSDFKKKSKQSAKVIDKMRKHLVADWQSLFTKKKPAKKVKPRKKSKK